MFPFCGLFFYPCGYPGTLLIKHGYLNFWFTSLKIFCYWMVLYEFHKCWVHHNIGIFGDFISKFRRVFLLLPRSIKMSVKDVWKIPCWLKSEHVWEGLIFFMFFLSCHLKYNKIFKRYVLVPIILFPFNIWLE